MAGSYRHVTDSKNEFIGIGLIENLGDAHEAIEEMYDMIQHLSDGRMTVVHEAWLKGHIRKRHGQAHIDADPKIFTYKSFWYDDDGD